jgi:hypothetical protein
MNPCKPTKVRVRDRGNARRVCRSSGLEPQTLHLCQRDALTNQATGLKFAESISYAAVIVLYILKHARCRWMLVGEGHLSRSSSSEHAEADRSATVCVRLARQERGKCRAGEDTG